MKVLQFSKFYPPVHGGIETAAFELTEGLNRLGVRSDVLCVDPGRGCSVELASAGHHVYRAPVDFSLASMPVSHRLFPLARERMKDCDLVHVHMPNPLAAAAIACYRPVCKVVLHWHSDVVRQRFTRRLYEPLQRWILERADAVIATSPDYACSSLPLATVKDKVSVIPIGIEDPSPRVDSERVARIRSRYPGQTLIVAAGRLAYYKGFDVLIDAAARLGSQVQVLIVGNGPLMPTLSRQVYSLGLADRVQLLGSLDDADLLAHLAAADVFCLPSVLRSEAYGIVMLEAMACSRPVVSCRIEGSGVPWINQHGVTGLHVPPRCPNELAQALSHLVQNPGLAQRYGAAGRSRFVETFQAKSMTQQILGLYRTLLAPRAETTRPGGSCGFRADIERTDLQR